MPAFVRFGEDEFRDGVDITTEDFYARLARDKDVFPTTSQPSPGDFKTVYDKLLGEHDEIVSIHISSAVSGTYASAVSGAEQSDPSGEADQTRRLPDRLDGDGFYRVGSAKGHR